MENASKALIMAGGILIALLVIGALLLMFNQIGAYQKSNSSSVKDSQLAAFNQDFARYAEGEIKGVDIISLVNKVIDFNSKEGVKNSVDYDKKITVKINLATGNPNFKTKYGVAGNASLFTSNTYEISMSNHTWEDIDNLRNYENNYTLGVMSKLSANYDTIKDAYDESTSKGKDAVKKVAGKDVKNKETGETITLKEIEQYREYSEFKTSTFKSSADPKYDNGQIIELSFEFVK